MNDIETIRARFKEIIGTDVPVNKKNKAEWMEQKIKDHLSDNKKEKVSKPETKTEKVPDHVQGVMDKVKAKDLRGKFYTGDYVIISDEKGITFKLNA